MKIMAVIHRWASTFLVLFLLCGFVVTCSFLTFFHGVEPDAQAVRSAAVYTLFNIVVLTMAFAALDEVRRRYMVERPIREIQRALSQIMSGDFSVRLNPAHSPQNFAGIMESINDMTRELSGVETLKADFIANVSHEMKTPLTVIRNYGVLLQAQDLPENKRIEYAKAVTDSSRRLSDLMTNILKLNRLENQQIFPQTKVFDLGEQLCSCLLQFESVWEDTGVEIETDISEDVSVRADDELLELVWSNLLSNAFKFTDRGGVVSVSLSCDAQDAIVRVSDTGCGMTPEVGAHIFEKFYQGDTSRATQGNGLGLALVKRIIDIMGGEISVSSTLGEGSTFTVRLRRE